MPLGKQYLSVVRERYLKAKPGKEKAEIWLDTG